MDAEALGAALGIYQRQAARERQDAAPAAAVLETSRCPCCEAWVWGRRQRDGMGGEFYSSPRWVYRLDLREWVCEECSRELGPDRVREEIREKLEALKAKEA